MMIVKARRLGFFAAILLASLQFGRAQDLTEPVTFVFTRTNLPLWHLTGEYDIVQQIKGAGGQLVTCAFHIALTHDARGRLEGTGTTIVQVGTSFLAGTYKAQGRISGGSTHPARVNLTVNIKGEDYLSGQLTPFSINLTYKLDVDADALALVGTVRGQTAFSRVGGGGPVKSDVVVPLALNDTGAWLVTMNITPLSHMTGVGTTLVSDGAQLDSVLSGSFSSKSGVANVKLNGIDASQGSSMNIRFFPTATGNELDRLRGKAFGQTLRF